MCTYVYYIYIYIYIYIPSLLSAEAGPYVFLDLVGVGDLKVPTVYQSEGYPNGIFAPCACCSLGTCQDGCTVGTSPPPSLASF